MPHPQDSSTSGTSLGLLERVRAEDERAWSRLVTLYSPLVYHWCRRSGLQPTDTEDIFQEVFRAVLTHVHGFRKRKAHDTFRGWLATITRNKIRDHFRRLGREPAAQGGTEAQRQLSQVPAPPPPVAAPPSDADMDRGLQARALELIRTEFREHTWRAFWRTAVDGQPAPSVAEELSMTPGAVRVAKSRVLQRLREELGDLPASD